MTIENGGEHPRSGPTGRIRRDTRVLGSVSDHLLDARHGARVRHRHRALVLPPVSWRRAGAARTNRPWLSWTFGDGNLDVLENPVASDRMNFLRRFTETC
ncbi:hypothetical protein, partial [Bradyrhizobium japonicum]|uniref:hypothetical protein n=1 Tax=Bradyrhizobium japonicum TaxID=375 RepID=UPI00216A7037